MIILMLLLSSCRKDRWLEILCSRCLLKTIRHRINRPAWTGVPVMAGLLACQLKSMGITSSEGPLSGQGTCFPNKSRDPHFELVSEQLEDSTCPRIAQWPCWWSSVEDDNEGRRNSSKNSSSNCRLHSVALLRIMGSYRDDWWWCSIKAPQIENVIWSQP